MINFFDIAVRTGSVIFLVGVGSLVCWKLWDHWRGGDQDTPSGDPSLNPSPPTTPSKGASTRERARGLLASLLAEDLVQDTGDFQDDDPALIQASILFDTSIALTRFISQIER